jgi:hypothetical protein
MYATLTILGATAILAGVFIGSFVIFGILTGTSTIDGAWVSTIFILTGVGMTISRKRYSPRKIN